MLDDSLFPFIDIDAEATDAENSTNELPICKEYAWDFDNNDFLLKDGKFQTVEGNEAIKIWIWKALHTQRYRYPAYYWDYGHELEELIDQGLSDEAIKSEAERYINEALSLNKYITDVSVTNISIDGSKVNVDFTVTTIYGEVSINV